MDDPTQADPRPEQLSDQRVTASSTNRGHEQSRDLLAKAVAVAVLVGGVNAVVQLVRLAIAH